MLYAVPMTRSSALTLSLLVASAAATTWLVSTLKPSTHTSYAFWTLWLNVANLAVALTPVLRRSAATTSLATNFACAAVPASGLLFIADTVCLHPDAQGSIGLLLTPVVQAASAALSFSLVRALTQRR
jgi:hypothetical protein